MKASSLILGLVVAGTLGFLAVLAAVFLMGDPDAVPPPKVAPIASAAPIPPDITRVEHQLRIAERAVSSESLIAMAIERFQRTMNRYPQTLAELTTQPEKSEEGGHWDGPYLNNPQLLVDPWGNPYQYAYPGRHNDFTYDLWSHGPDGKPNTADDVGNW